ncbi:MAG: phosphate/phosphite/phosphonate ABC transporter substrate-binding protein [Pseudonocardia sp.]|nr:phosphate/phosphite/phosphonate ABC transporter substrate-binding protein [Pseudonocardia sp.]
MRRIKVIALAALAMLTLAGCGGGGGPAPGVVRMAVTDLQGMEELQREFGAFVTELERASGLQVEFYPVNNRVAAAGALAGDQVDLVFTGPAEYVVLHERTDAEPLIGIRRPDYHSCIYTSRDSGITRIDQLRGKKIAMSDIGSTSGHLGPSQLLVDAGLDPQRDLEVLTVGDAQHQALVRGDVAAVGAGCHDYAEFTAKVPDAAAAFPILVEGPPLPPDIVMVRAGLDPRIVEQIRTAFEQNFPALLAAMLTGEDNAKYGNAELVAVRDGDYDVVRSMYRAIGVADTTEFVGE